MLIPLTFTKQQHCLSPTRLIIMIVLILFLSPPISKAQTTQTTDSVRHSTLLPVPIILYTPESGVIYSLSALYTFYADARDWHTRPSYMAVTGIYTSHEQGIANFYLNQWSKKNIYHY